MKLYIDLGCFSGDSVLRFIQDQGDDIDDWSVLGIDPNPTFYYQWTTITEQYTRVKFIQAAAWIENCELEFSLRDRPMGSTTNRDKQDFNRDGSLIQVKAIDFSEYLKLLSDQGYDAIWLKIDIEGSEFALLEKLLDDGNIELVSKVMIEWHDTKMGEKSAEYTARKEKIEKELTNREINWEIYA